MTASDQSREYPGNQAAQEKEQQIEKGNKEQRNERGRQICTLRSFHCECHAHPDERNRHYYHGLKKTAINRTCSLGTQ